MHELSIADSILRLAGEHVPPGASLQAVRIAAGPMRCIDPESMQLAWKGVTESRAGAIALELETLPWTLRCPKCEREWTSREVEMKCICGCDRPYPVGGDELRLLSIEVDD